MFILDSWNSFFRLVFWMASSGRSEGGKSRFGGGSGSGAGGGGGRSPEFEKVYKDHFEVVLAFFLRKGFSREDASDLTQETFIRVYQNIGKFRGDSSLKTWIISIAANIWRNELRRLQTKKRDHEEVPLEGAAENKLPVAGSLGSSPESLQRILFDEKTRELHQAIEGLPPQMRRCVRLRIQGLKYREIAELMKIEIGTVKAQLFQAKDRLK